MQEATVLWQNLVDFGETFVCAQVQNMNDLNHMILYQLDQNK
jgi:hypothetical protein